MDLWCISGLRRIEWTLVGARKRSKRNLPTRFNITARSLSHTKRDFSLAPSNVHRSSWLVLLVDRRMPSPQTEGLLLWYFVRNHHDSRKMCFIRTPRFVGSIFSLSTLAVEVTPSRSEIHVCREHAPTILPSLW